MPAGGPPEAGAGAGWPAELGPSSLSGESRFSEPATGGGAA
jgi:hypothetical protein